jgi:hypothetical protein
MVVAALEEALEFVGDTAVATYHVIEPVSKAYTTNKSITRFKLIGRSTRGARWINR